MEHTWSRGSRRFWKLSYFRNPGQVQVRSRASLLSPVFQTDTSGIPGLLLSRYPEVWLSMAHPGICSPGYLGVHSILSYVDFKVLHRYTRVYTFPTLLEYHDIDRCKSAWVIYCMEYSRQTNYSRWHLCPEDRPVLTDTIL